jgi:hypothetical protein
MKSNNTASATIWKQKLYRKLAEFNVQQYGNVLSMAVDKTPSEGIKTEDGRKRQSGRSRKRWTDEVTEENIRNNV